MNFVAIDFETADYSRESACSVGLAKFIGGECTDTFYSLIRPPALYVRPDFTVIHGLTVNDIKDAPKFSGIWDNGILPFIGNLPLAAHNAPFDMGVLKAVLNWYNLDIPKLEYFCTCNLSRRIWPRLKSHGLTALAKKFNIRYIAHNALEDAMTCGKLAVMAARKSGCKDIAELLHAAGLKNGTLKKS